MKIWIVTFDHEYGTDHHAFRKYDDAYDSVMDYLESWFPREDYEGPGAIPADYLEYVYDNTITISETEVK